MRKLATIREISNITNIDNSDTLAIATLDGWEVVVKRDEYKIGDSVIYCEIDSWIPNEIAPFLSKGKEPRLYNGVKGERLKTVRLRGQLSQGLILPVSILNSDFSLGEDVSSKLNIQLYEAPISAQLSGEAKGSFPSFLIKTDEERVQNLTYDKLRNETYYVTEKLDGSSISIYLKDGVFGVCSRNLDLLESDSNTFWKTARSLKIESLLKENGLNDIALQGELIGEGVQGNKYGIKGHTIRFFNAFDIQKQSYYKFEDFKNLIQKLKLTTVPIISESMCLPEDRRDLLLYAEGNSMLKDTEREGLVYRTLNENRISFKVISNKFLLKEKD